ncbi:MAG: hypothetical protein KIY12_07320 [Thermoplasmata archaeon]|uniref:Nmd3 N-terminal domain-containing protein n=1 Tax=Candidatus Sysuiplasma superficiale TaxID=2823368 RepID=A0A8J8CI17_9ARCH|nr:hypothetical protein [Candidatus Sysuiplasma superficiale]MBX8644513.1 hypothetical protein [Candidatus Sysuiplasma superficiale]
MFCIKCGREAIRGMVFCEECYSQSEPFAKLQQSFVFSTCPSCGRFREGQHWVEVGDRIEYVYSAVRKSLETIPGTSVLSFELSGFREDQNSFPLHVSFETRNSGVTRKEEGEVNVRVQRNTCPTCSRRSGHYFESTIQIRALGRMRSELMADAEEFVRKLCADTAAREPDFFVSSIRSTRGGVDMTLSSSSAGYSIARSAAHHFGTGVVATRSLYGQKDGRNIYRTTYLLRVPMLAAGDYVEYAGAHYRVSDTSGGVVLEPLSGGRRMHLPFQDLERVRFIGGREMETQLTVKSSTGGRITVVDMSTMTEEVLRYGRAVRNGESIRAVRLGERLYPL